MGDSKKESPMELPDNLELDKVEVAKFELMRS